MPVSGLILFIDDDVVDGLEVLPASLAGWCSGQIAAAGRFAFRHELSDGAGWSDIYVRPPAPADIEGLRIPFDAAAQALARHLPEMDGVVTGSPDAPRPIPLARAFGRSPFAAIVLYRNAGQRHLRSIELALRAEPDECLAVLRAAATLPTPEPLMIVGWRAARLARFDHPEELARFAALPG